MVWGHREWGEFRELCGDEDLCAQDHDKLKQKKVQCITSPACRRHKSGDLEIPIITWPSPEGGEGGEGGGGTVAHGWGMTGGGGRTNPQTLLLFCGLQIRSSPPPPIVFRMNVHVAQ